MSKLASIQWTPTCCAWHGEYAESPTADGGMVRIKRTPEARGYLVMRFDASNTPIDVNGDGVPDYVTMTDEEVEAILA